MLERDVIERIYRRNFKHMFAIAAAIAGEDLARDSVHDVFIKFCDMDTLPANPDAYLAIAVRNHAISVVRQMSDRERILNHLPLQDNSDEVSFPSADELEGIVDNQLSPKVREVVKKVFYQDKSYKQAATELQVSVATINKHIVTALSILRTILKTQSK